MNTQSRTPSSDAEVRVRDDFEKMAWPREAIQASLADFDEALEAARAERRRGAVREIERRFQNEAQRHNGREYYYDVRQVNAILDEVAALNASESPPTDEDDDAERIYTEDEYIDYGVVQYRRGKAQAEYEAAHPVGDASESGPTERRCFCGEPAEWPDGKCDKHHSRRGLGDASESVQPPESHDDE